MAVVGVSPTTRAIGIAILKNRKLIYWKKLSFHEKWSKQKLKLMITSLAKEVEKYDTTDIAIKIPDELPMSKAYMQLLGTINIMCEQMMIKPRYYTLSDLKDRICKERCTKQQLITRMISHCPDLHSMCSTKNRKPRVYYNQVFEAVATAYCKQNEV